MNGAWCVLRNYASHVAEMKSAPTQRPLFFLKPCSALIEMPVNSDSPEQSSPEHSNPEPTSPDGAGPSEASIDEQRPIEITVSTEEDIEYEVEWVVRLGSDLRPEAMCVGIDLTNRTRQGVAKVNGWPWLESKGFAASGLLGNWIQYDDSEFDLELTLNGELRQKDSTKMMIHNIKKLLITLNSTYKISPGDLLFTGTPAGVGRLLPGDVVNASLLNGRERISTLSVVCN
jgi:2-keto-4-pentenoate hydratase/2-oxohepta-3-ene-1,7-dioic acid hydratase in catechol pathway